MLGTCTPDNKQKLDSIYSFCEAYDPSAPLEVSKPEANSKILVHRAQDRDLLDLTLSHSGHSPFRQWPFSPWSIRWSVQGQKLEHIDSACSCPSLHGLSLGVVSTPYCRAEKLTLVN
ncbi:hypothetical protein KIW84_075052 [Lathyrus oleraceus]|uniref:Uncharacterized protein n=1 Tax=Pisum sativum TaxID=3888 RepID=A0A9D5A1E8_PEA|nr:hypothetical protein KIW84_075052 [Pisum sativum]